MNANEQLISRFYEAFNKLDAAAMSACYSNDIVFFDPVFELLRGREVRSMWEMLCKNAKGFSLTFGNIKDIGDDYYTCEWVATYIFSKTGRTVVNRVKANMKVLNGEITEHSDGFSLHKWAKQALGFSGWLLGWNGYFRQKIKNGAKKNLLAYMNH